MLRNKYVIISALILVAILSTTGYLLFVHKKPVASSLGMYPSSYVASNPQDTSNSVPLNPAATGEASNNSGGLSVSNSNANEGLGEQGSNQSTDGSSSSGNSSSSSSSSSSALDPSTFSAYNKYQNATSALYGDVQVGSGATLTTGHQASVYYKGWLTNGELFDESRTDSNGNLQPFTFTLGAHQVIAGWEEGLSGMKVGGTRLLIVPPAVGYGSQGQGSIPPNSVLVFEVQLIAVQ